MTLTDLPMLSRSQHLVLCLLGGLAIVLAITNAWLVAGNRGVQAEINQRQQFLQQTAPLEVLYRDIAKALAELALKSNDRRVLDMLAGQGINVSPNAPPAAPSSTPAAPGTTLPSSAGKR